MRMDAEQRAFSLVADELNFRFVNLPERRERRQSVFDKRPHAFAGGNAQVSDNDFHRGFCVVFNSQRVCCALGSRKPGQRTAVAEPIKTNQLSTS
jgi:hypothetical protein